MSCKLHQFYCIHLDLWFRDRYSANLSHKCTRLCSMWHCSTFRTARYPCPLIRLLTILHADNTLIMATLLTHAILGSQTFAVAGLVTRNSLLPALLDSALFVNLFARLQRMHFFTWQLCAITQCLTLSSQMY